MPQSTDRRKLAQGGNALIEFSIAFAFLVPLIVGLGAFGLGLIRYLQVSSINRTAGSMFVRGTDFSDAGSKKILGRVSGDLGLADASFNILATGKGLITLTVLRRVGSSDCAPLIAAGTACTNQNKVVITRQIMLGNTSLRHSSFGSPTAGQNPDGTFPSAIFLTNSSFAVAEFNTAPNDVTATAGAPVDLRAGETAYVSESFFIAPEWNLFPRLYNMSGYFHRNFF